MKWVVRVSLISIFFALGLSSCGGSGPLFLIFPFEPTVKKGQTQQFTANKDQVLWSVEGGNANGSIDATGLYTAPKDLPLDPLVTVRATSGSDTTTNSVHLVTADTLIFPSEPTPVSRDGMDDEGLRNPGAQDRLALAQAGSRIDVAWGGASGGDVLFDQQVNFAGFGNGRDLTNSPELDLALAMEEDLKDNPMLLFNAGGVDNANPGRIEILASKDGGASFGQPVMILPSVPATDFQFQGSLTVDAKNVLHVVFENGPNSGVGFFPIDGTLFYSNSSDGGDTWSANPVPIVTPPGTDDVISDPNIQVDSKGNIDVCYSVDPDGGAGPKTFDVFFAQSRDEGKSFNVVNLSNTSTADETFCHLALGPKGEIYLTYTSDNSGDSDIVFRRSIDEGANFSAPKTVNSDTAGVQNQGFISVDPVGRLAVVWGSDTDGDLLTDTLLFSQSLDRGDSFSPNLAIAGGPPAALFAVPMGLRHDSAGRLHLLFASTGDLSSTAAIFYLRAD